MKFPLTLQLNVMPHRTLLHARINQFLQNNQLYPTRVDDMTVVQLIKAHISDLLMPPINTERVVSICNAEFGLGNGGGWYTQQLDGVDPFFIRATRTFHQDILDATLCDIEDTIFNAGKAPANWLWDIAMGPWGAMIISPIRPVTTVVEERVATPMILCGAVKQSLGRPEKKIDVRYIPATLEQEDEPNAFILSELLNGSRQMHRRSPLVMKPVSLPSNLRDVVDDLIKSKEGYIERGRYD